MTTCSVLDINIIKVLYVLLYIYMYIHNLILYTRADIIMCFLVCVGPVYGQNAPVHVSSPYNGQVNVLCV